MQSEMTRMYLWAVWKDEVAVWMYQRAEIGTFFFGKMAQKGPFLIDPDFFFESGVSGVLNAFWEDKWRF